MILSGMTLTMEVSNGASEWCSEQHGIRSGTVLQLLAVCTAKFLLPCFCFKEALRLHQPGSLHIDLRPCSPYHLPTLEG